MSNITGPYSPLKIFHHQDRIEQLRRGEQIIPTHVQLVPSDWCSHGCLWCSYRWDGNVSNELFHIIDPKTGEKNHNPKRMIPLRKCIEIIDDLADMGVRALQLTGGGEPTAHPDFLSILIHAIERGLDVSLVTHGVLLKPDAISALTRASWVRVSVDCATKETYSSMRRVSESQFYRALENIRLLCEARDRNGSSLAVGMGFVLSKENWREVVDAARIAKSLGVDTFRISAVFQPENERYYDGFYEAARDLCFEAEKLTDPPGGRFMVVNSFGRRIEDLRQGHPDYKQCGYMQFTTYISGTLQVFRCCNTSYSTHGLVGSIANQRFRDLWLSEEKQENFRQFDARSCERCQFHRQNQAILYAIEQKPKHVNFV